MSEAEWLAVKKCLETVLGLDIMLDLSTACLYFTLLYFTLIVSSLRQN